MVTIYGSSIDGGFTSGTSLVAIYTYGCQVWPSEESWNGPWPGPEVHPGDYYISWTPTNITGTFIIDSVVYNLEDYNGYFDDFSGTITMNAFKDNTNMVSMETTATRLSYGAFRHCVSLESADLLHCVSIGQYAFTSCINLHSVSLPECKSIDSSAFSSCVTLEVVNLPQVEIIGSNAFMNCWGGRYLSIGSNCNNIGSNAFYSFGWSTYNSGGSVTLRAGWEGEGVIYAGAQGKFTRVECPAWKRVEYIISGWTTNDIEVYYHIRYPGFNSYYFSNYNLGRPVGGYLYSSDYASAGNPVSFETDAIGVASFESGPNIMTKWGLMSTPIVSVSMSQLRVVGVRGFMDCSDLEDLYAPNIQVIYQRGFKGCSKLPYFLLPVCSSIESYAFEGCTSLSYVMIGSNYCEIGEGTFSDCTNLTAIYVKSSRVSYFKSSTYWSAYSDIIYPISEY